jgi:hypothetical protein
MTHDETGIFRRKDEVTEKQLLSRRLRVPPAFWAIGGTKSQERSGTLERP